MGTAVNRTTFEIRLSVNPPDYGLAEWVIDPVIPEEPTRYWVNPIVGDAIVLKRRCWPSCGRCCSILRI